MQNSLSVPPKDQGDVSVFTSPVKIHLTQEMSETPRKTVCTGESNIPSGKIQSGKGLKSKSQFRTIAPKIVPRVLTSRMLPCHSPSLSDQVNLGPSFSAKPLGMSTQNYALMQVAGQEGTFSLVALPNVASAQAIQKPRMPLPENLKLPIPRYQPPRNNKESRKKPILSPPESGCSKPPAQTQGFPQMSLTSTDQPELPHKPSPFEQVPSLEQTPASISTATLTNGCDHGDSRPPETKSCGHLNPAATSISSTPEGPSAKQGPTEISGRANFTSKNTSSKPAAVTSENLKEQIDLAKAMTKLSPGVLGSAVQWISAVPRGKVPILPYSRMKAAEAYKMESSANTAGFSLLGHGADGDKTSTVTECFDAATKMASKMPASQVSQQSPCENACCIATKLDLNHKTKLNSGAAKRNGRKRKVPDEILALQGKRRKCIINKFRDGKERVKTDSQESRDQKPGAVKKYRSIMPKPVIVIPTLAPLASPAATLQSQTLRGLGQDTLLNNSLTAKCLGPKQDNSPSPKPSSVFRSGFSGTKKPWHRCHVCNHHFQFKQHLQDHMNTHTNRRPYSCRICRKAYVRSGSLSTHMKLHHGENRLKKLMCCEFCAKVFGHVRVYFGHLKEVHRVVISTEPSPGEVQPGDMPKNRDTSVQGTEGSLERENKSSLEEDFLLNQADEVKLQIKCGRCQITAQSFAEIKFHLLYVHGEEIQGRLQQGILTGSKVAQEALVKHATPDWKPHPERRKLVKHSPSEEELHALPKLKRQLYLHHQNGVEILVENEGAQPGTDEPRESPRSPEGPGLHTVLLWSHSGFNCLLCPQVLGRREDLLLHWERQHSCQDPSRLWAILDAFSNQGVIELSSETEK
uniref:Zinc finger protein 438 n=2 Tax=Microcebus murinus TaxID=30608 RepID=A0A8B7I1G9_MICMU|nr:zinc finger protein 438 isoform X1 [Microcebus murinus]XP_012644478.1 zinc finger protein 438 isoform X1 [Microcebus murinus]XP_012644479.1 zinc finger protein 438 isoform X1 [Microcebus murinus]XP_012644480.1 zinc finger protein 438 isoform X1 [Microcebus murinus]XP_012644481.1 zinc finger protein 438 isoform X1 [Microcebus murinus]XP_012644482.1 zinc finger protein 438 isoform X1 [Microcebus murinus]XP_012644483.1 zinc finger protein 438 isoform X1 [Microcebus murinus]XP_012644484.1 zin